MTNMKTQEPNQRRTNSTLSVLGGMLVGSMACALAMLLLAPRSGEDTRKQIQEKGIELRDRAAGMVDEAVAQVRSSASKISIGGREKIQEIKQQGQDLAVEQLDRVTAAAQTGKKAIQAAS